jgi:hypothetical protein
MFKIEDAKQKLKELDEILRKKCPNMSLEIGFHKDFKKRENVSIYENMINPQIILCLNHGDACVSSIACKINKKTKTMEISSKTHENYEGKKYNTLLRSVIMLVAPFIKYKRATSKTRKSSASSRSRSVTKGNHYVQGSVAKIISRSINPISTLLLVKYFGATNTELQEYLDNNGIDVLALSLDQVKEFQQEVNTDDMTSSEELEYMENNEDYGEPLLLTIELSNPGVNSKIRNTFDSTIARMICS